MTRPLLHRHDIGDALKQWRTRAVTIIFYIAAVAALPAYVFSAVQSFAINRFETLLVLTVVYILIVMAAIFRKLDYRLRGWFFIGAGYLMAVTTMASLGLEGSGRIYLLSMPIIAFTLIGSRAGWITTVLSIVCYGIFSLLAYNGGLETWLVPLPDRVSNAMWISGGLTSAMLLILTVVLLMRMNRFLAGVLASERRLLAELEEAYDKTLEGWARALELRDIETSGHCQRVSEVTMRLARQAGLDSGEKVDMRRGSLLHDIGKMGIPDSILLKPGKLTDEEFRQMRKHTTYAYDLLAHIPYLQKALDIPYCHHEKWDGTGYPRGLKGVDIPMSARIFSVVDVYDALVSDRPYRDAWPEEQALAYIKERAGTEFDPAAVEAFVCLVEQEAVR